MLRLLLTALCACAAAGFTTTASAIAPSSANVAEYVTTLTHPDNATSILYGYASAISGDLCVVGARGGDGITASTGAAYVYRRTPGGMWNYEATIMADDGQEWDFFGDAVAIDGDVCIVGAPSADPVAVASGAAYVFRRASNGTWSQEAKFVYENATDNDRFGDRVDISGDLCIVGANQADVAGNLSGGAWIFRYNTDGTWCLEDSLLSDDIAASDRFGGGVSIDGDLCVIGAFCDDDAGSSSGAVYAFRRNADSSWTQEAKMLTNDASASKAFSSNISLDGDRFVAGVYLDDVNGNRSGSAYIFRRTAPGTWVQESKLLPSDGAAEDYFGLGVALDGDICLVGARRDDDKGDDTGSAYVFQRGSDGTWTQVQKIVPAAVEAGDRFGASVSVSGDYCVIGASEADEAHVFSITPLTSVSISTSPAGLSFSVDGTDYDSPQTFSWPEGSSHTIAVTSPQDNLVGNEFAFDAWSDGGAASHQVTVTSDSSFVASFDRNTDLSTLSWQEVAKVLASDGASGDNFGSSISVSGNVAVIGAMYDESYTGSAYIFRRGSDGNWSQEAKLMASDGANSDYFGYSASVSGDVAVIGAMYDESYIGSAYIFRRGSDGNWSQEAKLTASDGTSGDYFGSSVSVNGDVAVISAYGDESSTGSAYVFRRGSDGNWSQEAKLTASDGAPNDLFGFFVSVSGEVAVIGAYGDESSTGSAYVFRRGSDGSWSQETKLTASDGASGDTFGASVSVSGDVAVIGAENDESSTGSAYVFRYADGSWSQETKLTASDGVSGDTFGSSVSVSGDVIVACARGDESSTGSAYVFRHADGSWSQEAKLTDSDGANNDSFGYSISVSGDVIMAGASGDESSTGSAVVYELAPPPPVAVTVGTSPAGLSFSVDGTDYDTPQTFAWEIGSSHTIAVTSPQDNLVGNEFAFDAWSDGGAASHQVTVTSDSSFVATFSRTQDVSILEWEETATAFASDSADGDKFGSAISVDGDVCVVGAYYSDDNGDLSGSAYIFRRNMNGSWTQEAKLLPTDGAASDRFGGSVSISGDVCIVGAKEKDDTGTNLGAAYVFRRGTGGSWSQEAKLQATDAADNDNFGGSVSIDGDVCIVGALLNDDNGDNSGSAYIFRRSTGGSWSQEAKLLPADGAASDYFGYSVSLSGETCVVTASSDDDNGDDSGSAYVFRHSSTGSWSQEAKLLPTDGEGGDSFGHSVSLSGDVCIVGASYDDDNGSHSGSAYVFRRGTGGSWAQEAKLLPADGATLDNFGYSVSVSSEACIVGAYGDGDNGNYSGSAYVFRHSTGGLWVQEAKLLAAAGSAGDYFGTTVSMSGDICLAGALSDNGVGSMSAFELTVPEVSVEVSTSPAGLSFTADGTEYESPQTFSWEVGSSHTIAVASPQDNLVGNEFTFDAWSDGGAMSHQVTIAGDSSFVATFTRTADISTQSWQETAQALASDGDATDQFGAAVSLNGGVCVIGANYDDDTDDYAGSAYIYRRGLDGTWAEEAKLLASDGYNRDQFGRAVAIEGDYAVVGAWQKQEISDPSIKIGRAYVFHRESNGTWIEQAQLNPSNGATGNRFGWSVDICGDLCVVGASLNSSNGAAYIFRRNSDGTWTEEAILTADDAALSDMFGCSVSLDGGVCIVGAYENDDAGDGSGSAYVFRRSGDGTWSQEAKLVADDAAEDDNFGFSVSLDGGTCVIGAYKDDDLAGSAYVFSRGTGGTWNQEAKLVAEDAAANNWLGGSVSISGDMCLIGAVGCSDYGTLSGAAYVFHRGSDGSWTQKDRLTASSGATNDYFGQAVAIDGDECFIGAFKNSDTANDAGAAFVFELAPRPPVSIVVSTSPAGLSFTADGTDYESPQTFLWEVGSSHTIAVTSPQDNLVGNEFTFDAWSDGGAASHEVTITDDSSFVATFTRTADMTTLSWQETAKALASDGAASDQFGFAVSMSGDVAVVGAYGDESNTGSAYVLRRGSDGSWSQEAKLTASDGAADDNFGWSVSVSDTVAVIGAYGDESNAGSAYVFRYSGGSWLQEAKLTASDGAADDYFGRSVSVNGDVVVVGANGNESGTGAAYVFRYADGNWSQETKLTASDGAADDYFGRSVSLNGDVVVIGAYGVETSTGAAYVFRYADGNWSQETKLTAADGTSPDRFGGSVSVSGNVAVIGAHYNDLVGAAYVFRYADGSWSQESKLTASGDFDSDRFGWSVSVSDNVAVIGSYSDGITGSAFIFRYSNGSWSQEEKLTVSGSATNDCFGQAVAVDGDGCFIGAYMDNDTATDAGAAFMFELATNHPPVWAVRNDTTAAEGELLTFTVEATDAEGDPLTYEATQLPTGAEFTPETRVFSWTPTFTQAGEDTAIFSVTAAGMAVLDTVAITVNQTNRAPVIDSLASLLPEAYVGYSLVDTLHSTDPDEEDWGKLTWEVVDGDGLEHFIIVRDSILTHTEFTEEDTVGVHNVVFRVTDPAGASDEVTLVLKIVTPVGIDMPRPTETALLGNAPNPFNPTTAIRFSLASDAHVTVTVYDVLGQQVTTLVNELRAAGYYTAVWNGRDAVGRPSASGPYFVRMVCGDYVSTRRMMLVR